MKKILRPSTLFIIFCVLAVASCAQTVQRRQATGKMFPTVRGESLKKEAKILPNDIVGQPTVLLVGYVQKAQFDIDRWILGLKQLDVGTEIIEVPTIAGMLPGMAADFINSGMRRGIPEEDWASVITVYDDANKIVELTGNENPNNARVFLLNKAGEIVWFFDRGYSAAKVLELVNSIKSLN